MRNICLYARGRNEVFIVEMKESAEEYLYLNGLTTSKDIQLHKDVILSPISAPLQRKKVSELIENDIEYAATIICGSTIASQLRIHPHIDNEEELAIAAWNAVWDCILLGAILQCEVMANLQCDKPVEDLEMAQYLYVTNKALHAVYSEPYQLTPDDEEWINLHYEKAHDLLGKDQFLTAVHAMASYKWHSMPRVQLAILWSGIESLFEASTEVSFRISLYIANFLAGDDAAEAKRLFERTRKLYESRSKAVHGGKIKGELDDLISESAMLLNRLIRRCAEIGALPDTRKLVFPSGFLNQSEE